MGAGQYDLTAAQPPMPADATAVAPPNMGGEPQPGPTYYERLRDLFNEIVRLAHVKDKNGKRKYSAKELDVHLRLRRDELFQTQQRFRTVAGLARTLQNMERRGERPINEQDLSPIEKGVFARTALFGQSVLPWSDELAGVGSAIVPGGKGYTEGRDEQRRYMERAREFSVNQGPLNPEAWGLPAMILATMGLGAPAAGSRAPSFLTMGARTSQGGLGPLARGTANILNPANPTFPGAVARGGATALGYSLGEQPELTGEALKENAVPLAFTTALGALLGGGTSLLGTKAAYKTQPGPMHMEDVWEATGITHPRGGLGALEEAIGMSGVQRPMLAELETSSFGGLANELIRGSRESVGKARRLVQQELNSLRAEKAAFNPVYDALQIPVNDPRLVQLTSSERTQLVIRQLMKDKRIVEGQPLTGRAIEDIRQEMGKRANRAFRRGDDVAGDVFADLQEQARIILDENFDHMPGIRRQLQPLINRERQIEQLQRNLYRRARGGAVPLQTKTTAGGETEKALGTERYQRAHRAYQQMADMLYTPGTALEHQARIFGRVPWFSPLGRMAPAGAGASGFINPFFPMQPQEQ